MSEPRRVLVVGGGILGTAVARRLQVVVGAHVTVAEKESRLASHQTGRNSGVVHAGLYYPPGSLKSVLCRRGVGLLGEYCSCRGIPFHEIGKTVVAIEPDELGRLDALEQRARANGVPGLRRVRGDDIGALEPHVRGLSALHSPTTAIVDYTAVTRHLAADIVEHCGTVSLGTEIIGLRRTSTGAAASWRSTTRGDHDDQFDLVVVCAGLQADRLSVLAGGSAEPRILPFRGEYLSLRPEHRGLVRGLVYPVPDPRYPFLGVHLTPMVSGEVLIGPNAVLALAREGYSWRDISRRDLADTLAWPGFRRFARANWRTGLDEVWRSWSSRRFVASARRYVPELRSSHVTTGPRGVRAQAMDRSGALVDDFRIDSVGPVWSLRNAPSPAATSSLAIAEHLVETILSGPR